MTCVLGIDPGLRNVGFAILKQTHAYDPPALVEAGVLELNTRTAIETRLHELDQEMRQIIAEHQPDHLAVEKLYAHYKHPRTAILMAHARGVILQVAVSFGIRIHHVAATHVKKLMTGHGQASKEQMQRAVQFRFELDQPPSPPDIADAIAIASACAHRLHLADLTDQTDQTPQ